MKSSRISKHFESACDQYAEIGVDVNQALRKLKRIGISIPCWQGDDVRGFEARGASLEGSGLQVTGGYPGRARTIDELQADLSKALSLLPGNHRVNLHAIYGDFKGKQVERDDISFEHFKTWSRWASTERIMLDFNATCFAHPLAMSGYTLSSSDKRTREFWIRHAVSARRVAARIGRQQKSPCIHNLWIPDGAKETPVDRMARRATLKDSLDRIYDEHFAPNILLDSVESKLFGIGSESFVVGSHEFYLGYALRKKLMICLDMGHFHPTESIADKISSLLQFTPGLLLHLSRGVRWDSDHVVVLNDDLLDVCREAVRSGMLNNIHFALDYFDATINRVGALVLGGRAFLKGILIALLESPAKNARDGFSSLWLNERSKSMPWGTIWDQYCVQSRVPLDSEIGATISSYEKIVLTKRK